MAGESDLYISRFINASPSRVWKAWSEPQHLARWWIPSPMECKVVKLDVRPGGGFETLMREGDGAFQPHVEACFLDVEPQRRLVWTTALAEGWRPIAPWLTLTAVIEFTPRGEGTLYAARVMHKDGADAKKHQDLGFESGWSTVIDQLASYLTDEKAHSGG